LGNGSLQKTYLLFNKQQLLSKVDVSQPRRIFNDIENSSVCLYVCLYLCLFICLYVCLYVCLFTIYLVMIAVVVVVAVAVVVVVDIVLAGESSFDLARTFGTTSEHFQPNRLGL
jgi:uncharacterized membrane protein